MISSESRAKPPREGVLVPEAVSYEFTGVSDGDYAAVSRHLNINPDTETGDWPPGLLSHAAGTADDGAFIVAEVWSSRADQAAFVESRLGPALAAEGVTAVPRIRWMRVTHFHLAGG
jgi:hypothetical protein